MYWLYAFRHSLCISFFRVLKCLQWFSEFVRLAKLYWFCFLRRSCLIFLFIQGFFGFPVVILEGTNSFKTVFSKLQSESHVSSIGVSMVKWSQYSVQIGFVSARRHIFGPRNSRAITFTWCVSKSTRLLLPHHPTQRVGDFGGKWWSGARGPCLTFSITQLIFSLFFPWRILMRLSMCCSAAPPPPPPPPPPWPFLKTGRSPPFGGFCKIFFKTFFCF